MTTTAAVLATAVLGALAVFQIALICGAPFGRLAFGGRQRVLDRTRRIGSAVAVAGYAFAATVLVQSAGLAGPWLPPGVADVAVWVLAGYFLLGVGLNLASRSRPERLVMTPVAAVLSLCCLVVALA